MIKKFTLLVALLTAALVLAACGSDEPAHETHSSSSQDKFNDADVTFATDMIPHHAQALVMVDLTRGRTLDPKVSALTEAIQMAQTPEIEQMTTWLTDWHKPIPATMRDHVNAEGHGRMEMDSEMPGMMTGEQMSDLDAAKGPAFQRLWLEMMIEHHQGAIEMAKTEQSAGRFAPAIGLAKSIESSQQKEIDLMESLLGS
jgi:uncharacterized protein (DUF305 family)